MTIRMQRPAGGTRGRGIRAAADGSSGEEAGAADVVAGWRANHVALSGCVGADDVLAAVALDPDPALYALLVEVSHGCEVAATLIMEALLPRIRSLAALDAQAELGDYVTHLWLRLHTYPLERRPRRIAANLVLDTLKAVHRERTPRPLQLRDPAELPIIRASAPGSDAAPDDPTTDPTAEGVLRTAAALGLVDPVTHATLVSVYAHGLPASAAAELFRVSATTIRRRCNRGLRTLRNHADELAAAM